MEVSEGCSGRTNTCPRSGAITRPVRHIEPKISRKLGSNPPRTIPLTDDTIQNAVAAWCDDPGSAVGVYGNISDWDTGEVTDMSYLFTGADTGFGGYCSTYHTFNEDISKWNTSSVTTMWGMFLYAISFNGDVSAWNVSSVTTMKNMFSDASSFNGDVSAWNVSSVTTMYSMFYRASKFAQHLCWAISSGTDTYLIFGGTAGACIDKTCGGSVSDSGLFC